MGNGRVADVQYQDVNIDAVQPRANANAKKKGIMTTIIKRKTLGPETVGTGCLRDPGGFPPKMVGGEGKRETESALKQSISSGEELAERLNWLFRDIQWFRLRYIVGAQ